MPGKSKVKYIQSLGHKKFRDEEHAFVAEGPKLVRELLLEKVSVQELFATREWIDENKNLLNNILVTETTQQELERISFLTTPNQVLAVVKKISEGARIDCKDKITLMLDTIQDPGNMGTIIRTADWFGVSQIICSPDCADIYNPKVVQASMGSIVRVKVYYTELKEFLQRQQVRKYATTLEGKDVAHTKISEGIIIIGNESRGIHPEILAIANVKLNIRRMGKAESLNAAVATGIVLSHVTVH
jgi:RNA methyltransferase, TrmH family